MKPRKTDLTFSDMMDLCKQCLVCCLFILSIISLAFTADLSYSIPEEQPVNTFIGNILNDTNNLKSAINDQDYPNLQFSFLTEGNAVTSLFSLDAKSGDLSIGPNSKLDREIICPFAASCDIALDVVVQSPLHQLFRKVSVIVHLDDINDNAPTFINDFVSLLISEAVLVGASIPLEGASDRDKGFSNSLQTYEVDPSDGAFGVSFRKNLDGTTYLKLVVTKELDHEIKSKYSIQIIAKDGGEPQLQGVLKVAITVTDVNDNVPKFTQHNYSVNVDENVVQNNIILNVHAIDLDSGENGKVTYKLSSHQDSKIGKMFHIDPNTGNMSVIGNLQSEATEQYKIIVQASDHALQPFTSQAIVTVKVRDVINSPPKLTVNVLSSSTISEYANLGAVVAHVAVKESDRGRNGIVSCRLQSQHYFQLQGFDIDEYKVIVAVQLDSELTPRSNITIICQDAGTPPLTATFWFEVSIIDENDNAPEFMTKKYSATISENNQIGQTILKVYATDVDSGKNGRIHYSLTPDSSGQFQISAEDGVISANTEFDYETHRNVTFTVMAVDGGIPAKTATAKVTVLVLDVNDEYPQFSREIFTVIVSETAIPGDIVFQITAFDFESGQNGELEYHLLTKIPFTPFTVLINGSLVLDDSLDFETQQIYEFNVIVIDKGSPPLNTTARVVINVKDENDNIPIITFPNISTYLVNVSFSDNKGTVIAQLQVIDFDSGLNGQIHYVITSRNDSGRFEINSETGDILTTKFYSEKDINLYRLVISVQDKGVPPLATQTTVFVNIFPGNGTPATGSNGINEQNVLITLTIVCVTFVISALIVLVIVIMRRKETKRQNTNNDQTSENQEPSKYDEVKINNKNSLKSNMADDADFGFSMLIGKNLVQENPTCFDNNTQTTSLTDYDVSIDAQKNNCRQEQTKNLNEVMSAQRIFSQTHKQDSSDWSRTKQAADDINSDVSGDTTTSDSGRGGSEDDMCSHTGAQTFDEHNLSRDLQIGNSSFQSHGGTSGYSSRSLKPYLNSKTRDDGRSGSTKHVAFHASQPKNVRPCVGQPSSRDINVQSRGSDSDWRKSNIFREQYPNETLPQNMPSQRNERFSSQGEDYYLHDLNSPSFNYSDSGPNGKHVLSHSEFYPEFNDSIISMTTDDCDDRSTTTSGSYCIDNEEKFEPSQHNLWKDIVV